MQIIPQLFAILFRNFWKIHSATFCFSPPPNIVSVWVLREYSAKSH